MKSLTTGEWIESPEGIAQVISVIDVFAEEFCSEYRAGHKDLGDFLHTLVSYKLLCSNDGVLRSRQWITYSNRAGVAEASIDALDTVSRLQSEQPRRFDKFLEYKASVPIKHDYTAWLNVPEQLTNELAARINSFEADGSFTYDRLFKHLLVEAPFLDVKSVHREFSRPRNNLRLVLQNDDLKMLGKRALLAGVKATVV